MLLSKISDYFTKKWEQKVRDHCDSQYERIQVKPGDLHLYWKCHYVATHYAIENDHEKLALVTQREKQHTLPVIHFVNFDGKDFIDNSMGHWVNSYEYRFVRWVPKEEFYDTVYILGDTKKFFQKMATFFQRRFGDTEN